jgi:hypothetical protein
MQSIRAACPRIVHPIENLPQPGRNSRTPLEPKRYGNANRVKSFAYWAFASLYITSRDIDTTGSSRFYRI